MIPRFLLILLLPLALISFRCSSEDPTIPEGPGFEVLEEIPSAVELSESILASLGYGPFQERFPVREFRQALIRGALDLGLDERAQNLDSKKDCLNGGEARIQESSKDLDATFSISLDKCQVTLLLQETSFNVTLNGEITLEFKSTKEGLYSLETLASLTSEGELAFGTACHLQTTKIANSQYTGETQFEGSCIFLDSKGHRLESGAKDLRNYIFIGFGT